MKKGQIVQGVIERVDFPNKGIITTEEGKQVVVKNGIQGQKVSAAINKIRKGMNWQWQDVSMRQSAGDAPTRRFRMRSSWN